jgi:very-short-patch-repair endonuclease
MARKKSAEEGHYRGGFDFAGLADRARELRRKQTPTESLMWELLRDRRFMGLKFRRQHQVGDYLVDFYCDERKLALELDGPAHSDPAQMKHDKTRDAYLTAIGLTVLRFQNDDLIGDTEQVLQRIAAALSSPPGRGGRGEGVSLPSP